MTFKIKKMTYFGFLSGFLCLALCLTGCGKPIMPPIQYQQTIDVQLNKIAVLQWEFGRQYDIGVANVTYGNYVGTYGDTSVVSSNALSYGKAEQAIFMTSFKDVLEKNQVFKSVLLAGDAREVAQKDVIIDVCFKTARVGSEAQNFRITLTVVMTITSPGKPPFSKTYLVVSDPYLTPEFVMQQHDVSTRLMEKLIHGIEEWHRRK